MASLINRIWNILTKPSKGWVNISNENYSFQKVLITYTVPIIAFPTSTHFIRTYFILNEHSFLFSVIEALFFFSVFLISILITTWIIHKVQKSYEISTDQKSIFVLLSYALTPVYLAEAMANLNYSLRAFYVLSFYAVYLLWNGSSSLLWISDKQKVPFVLTSLIILFSLKTILYIYLLNLIHLFL